MLFRSLAAILPDLHIPTLDAGAQRVSAATHLASPTRQARPRLSESSPVHAVDRSETPRETSAEGGVFVACVLTWALVASLLLARRIIAEVGVHRLAREARPASLRLRRLGARLALLGLLQQAAGVRALSLELADRAPQPPHDESCCLPHR